jgi:hypothetical protein
VPSAREAPAAVAPASPLRQRLRAAACMLLASAAPAAAQTTGSSTTVDATALVYGEAHRANIFEPTARITRLFANGQTLSAQLGLDVMTGSSPTGQLPPGVVTQTAPQTVTTPSGNVVTNAPPSPSAIPLNKFRDLRGVLDLDWAVPIWLFTPEIGGHFSREKDYQSAGGNGKLSVDLMHRMTTVTVGGGYNRDGVFPVGGVTPGLSDSTVAPVKGTKPKDVATTMAGISHILSRRWMVSLNASRTYEKGYLTEPYKLISVVDPATGIPQGVVTEKRPSTRDRRSLLGSSVYHLANDVLYASYRYYWDDWNVRSHTVDLKVRHDLATENYIEPHVRYYTQTAASFFRSGLLLGAPLPDFATSDYRLGNLRTITVGGTYGFRIPDSPGEWTVRAEYIGQFGNGHPPDAVGVQRQFDLFPTTNIGELYVGYSVTY